MKNVPLFDILFIIVSAVVFSLMDYFGYANLLSKYAVVVAMIAYFSGKYIGQVELRKKLNRDRFHVAQNPPHES
ncbi:MAG: hypothetical protein NTZ69_02815 [Bacteroidia bacterium]|nr:hypothetical protein [Bacteroidia bacterium]